MKEGKNYIFRFRKRMQVFSMIHLLILMTGAILLIASLTNQSYVFLILSVSAFIIDCLVRFLANYFGWNSFIYFGEETIKQKIRGKEYAWQWKDLISCEINFIYARTPQTFDMVFSKSSKVLRFEITLYRQKILLKNCPNEQAKKILEKAFTNT